MLAAVVLAVQLGGMPSNTMWAQEPVPTPEAPPDSSLVARADSAPLFRSHEVLALTIAAPLETIFHDRTQESTESPGTLTYRTTRGDSVSIPVEIKTRGKARLSRSICAFPPLRLDFSDEGTEGTLFTGQDKLKLVTHCQDKRPDYEQNVLEEYLIYRSYNLLTSMSFRVRLARVTYIDTEAQRDTLTRYAFFIENDDMMAVRNGWQVVHAPVIPPDALDPPQLSLVEVFQYMIGNTDWSAFMSEPGELDCCHNTTPIGRSYGPVFPVPYDFDLTGLVSARYANRLFQANLEKMGLRSVRERLYKGRCASEPHWDSTFRAFRQHKEAIYSLYRDQVGLEEAERREALEYLDEFYDVINDASKVRSHIARRCRRI